MRAFEHCHDESWKDALEVGHDRCRNETIFACLKEKHWHANPG